ncbi:hypothetical protein PC116_g30457 [Phytophthora cactorum]|nr:hypothetical protein PC116_g30457 [Phytophthora cactorum]
MPSSSPGPKARKPRLILKTRTPRPDTPTAPSPLVVPDANLSYATVAGRTEQDNLPKPSSSPDYAAR